MSFEEPWPLVLGMPLSFKVCSGIGNHYDFGAFIIKKKFKMLSVLFKVNASFSFSFPFSFSF